MGLKKHYFKDDSETTKNKYLSDLKEFVLWMKQKYNLSIYLIYGTLLGAIRDKDFIAHDTDIDIAYLSNLTDEKELIQERKMLIKSLNSHKMLRTMKTRGIKIVFNESKFDMWTSYIIQEKVYLKPFGYVCDKKTLLPLQDLKFRNEVFLIPNNSRELLDKIYVTWQKPITKTQKYLKVHYEN